MASYSLHKTDKNHQHQVLDFCLSKAKALDSEGTLPYEGLTKACFSVLTFIAKYARIKQLEKLDSQQNKAFKGWSDKNTRVLLSVFPPRQENAR